MTENIKCCRVDCEKEVVKTQKICFRNSQGYVLKTKISWCKEHEPVYAHRDWENPDLFRCSEG